jgi:hypothetical protein
LAGIELSYQLLNEFKTVRGPGYFDWVLGWSISQGRPQQTLLLSHSDVLALMGLMWHDRKRFLQALAMCSPSDSPALSGLVYVFWRYVEYERQAAAIFLLLPRLT